jgi:phosphopantothenoylcysteine decarboxylase / phosphopantothenate---cysteine ligase
MKPLKLLITAGPTREPIDPVRFITNHSTGRMGYAIARHARKLGCSITLISGPTHLIRPAGVKTVYIQTAKEMLARVKHYFPRHDGLIMAAAVSDFRPKQYNPQKIKTEQSPPVIQLSKNADILAWAGRHKQHRIVVGFCMETEDLQKRARKKMHIKKCDLMVANKIQKLNKPFGPGQTNVLLFGPGETTDRACLVSKDIVARILLDKIANLWYKKQFQR